MRSPMNLVAPLLVVLGACAAPAVPDDTGPFEGAWRLTSMVNVAADGTRTDFTPQESLFLFRGAHYSMAFAYAEQPSAPYAVAFTPTDEESLARFGSMTVNTGTYEVTGSTAILRPLFALVPEFVGGSAEHEYELSGDTLTLRWGRTLAADGVESAFSAGGGRTELTLVRIR